MNLLGFVNHGRLRLRAFASAASGVRFLHDYQMSAMMSHAGLVGKSAALSISTILAQFSTVQLMGEVC